jgi:hypothetical protein
MGNLRGVFVGIGFWITGSGSDFPDISSGLWFVFFSVSEIDCKGCTIVIYGNKIVAVMN